MKPTTIDREFVQMYERKNGRDLSLRRFVNKQILAAGAASGVPSNVLDKELYLKAKEKIKKKVKHWPSAYASGMLVSEYKKRGGRYRTPKKSSGSKESGGIARWFKEKWIDVCTGKKCGRSQRSTRKYPFCRPSIKVTSKTPRIASSFTKSEIERLCNEKRKNPERKMPSTSRRKKSKRINRKLSLRGGSKQAGGSNRVPENIDEKQRQKNMDLKNMDLKNIYNEPLKPCRNQEGDSNGSWDSDGYCSEMDRGVHQICMGVTDKNKDFSAKTKQGNWSESRQGSNHCMCLGAYSLYKAGSKQARDRRDELQCDAIPSTALSKDYVSKWNRWNGNELPHQIQHGVDSLVKDCYVPSKKDSSSMTFLKKEYDALRKHYEKTNKSFTWRSVIE